MPGPPSFHRFGAIAAKSLFGIAVFASTTFAWAQFGGRLMRHVPLPNAGGATGSCAIWFVGSSSVYRWTSLQQDMAPWRVVNRGVNGASVLDVTARLAVERPDAAPDFIVFYIGENDIAAGASAAEAERGVATLIATAQERMPHVRTVVVGLKPSPARWSFRPEQLRFNALATTFARRMPRSSYIYPGDALLVDGRPGRYYLSDGVHLDGNGYRRWGRALRLAFERTVPAAELARCAGRPATAA